MPTHLPHSKQELVTAVHSLHDFSNNTPPVASSTTKRRYAHQFFSNKSKKSSTVNTYTAHRAFQACSAEQQLKAISKAFDSAARERTRARFPV